MSAGAAGPNPESDLGKYDPATPLLSLLRKILELPGLKTAIPWTVVYMLMYYPCICLASAIYNYLHYGPIIYEWPCWFQYDFWLGRGPFLGLFNPVWCWDYGKAFGWAWSVAEMIFFLWFQYARRHHEPPSKPPSMNDEERDQLFERCVDATDEPRDMLAGWFRASFEELQYGNVLEWLAWAFYAARLEELSATQKARLDGYMERMEEKWHLQLPQGYNTVLASTLMRPSLDPLRAQHRPLFVYGFLWFLRLMTEGNMHKSGFVPHKVGCLTIWIRPPDCGLEQATLRPLLLMHGLGLGASTMAPKLLDLLIPKYGGQSAILMPEMDCFSMCPRHAGVPSPEAAVASLVQAIELACPGPNQPKQATVFAQSTGTTFFSWLIKQSPQHVGAALIADPLVFLLHQPDFVQNWSYRPLDSFIRIFTQYFMSGELGLAKTMHRQFWWYQNVLWLEDLPQHLTRKGLIVAAMGSGDFLLPAQKICKYLRTGTGKAHTLRCLLVEGGDHILWLHWEAAKKAAVDLIAKIHLEDMTAEHDIHEGYEPPGYKTEEELTMEELRKKAEEDLECGPDDHAD